MAGLRPALEFRAWRVELDVSEPQLLGGVGVQLRKLFGHDPLPLSIAFALGGTRAPTSTHREDEPEEHDHPGDADPPPSLPLVGGGFLSGDYDLLRVKQGLEVSGTNGCDLRIRYRFTRLYRRGKWLESQ